MTPRVLLTGGTGFVGRQILNALQRANTDVRVVIRAGTEARLAASAPVERIFTKDLFAENALWWAKACDGIDTVIHAAWYAMPGKYMQSPMNLDCLQGTLQLAQGAAQANVRRFIGIGTCAEYDTNAGYLSVNTPLRPTNPYASAKAAAYFALNNWLPLLDIEFAWCRLFYLYGDGEDKQRLIPYVRSRLAMGRPVNLSSGFQVRDYLDVSIAGSKIAAVSLGNTTGAVNICSGQAQTVREMVERIADEFGRRDLLRFGTRPDNHFDPPCVVGVRD